MEMALSRSWDAAHRAVEFSTAASTRLHHPPIRMKEGLAESVSAPLLLIQIPAADTVMQVKAAALFQASARRSAKKPLGVCADAAVRAEGVLNRHDDRFVNMRGMAD